MTAGNARNLYLVAAVLAASVIGCGTTGVLRRQGVNYAKTPMDIHQQQVLDNLAKFVYDPHSMPSFSIAEDGQADVTDRFSGGLSSMSFDVSGFTDAVVGLDGSRQSRQFITMKSVNDPRKLELMRCAYQNAVANCHGGIEETCCPDCRKRFNKFYRGTTDKLEPWEFRPVKPSVEAVPTPAECERCDHQESRGTPDVAVALAEAPSIGSEAAQSVTPTMLMADLHTIQGRFELHRDSEPDNLVPAPCAENADGTVTSECLSPGCCYWFGHGPKECVPKDCDCAYVGHHCGHYVWVLPGKGRDELAKLTLAILDFATNEPAKERTKQVVLYRRVDRYGNEWAATKHTATKVVTIDVAKSDLAEGALAYPDDRSSLSTQATSSYVAQEIGPLVSPFLTGPNATDDGQKIIDLNHPLSKLMNKLNQLESETAEGLKREGPAVDSADTVSPIERGASSRGAAVSPLTAGTSAVDRLSPVILPDP